MNAQTGFENCLSAALRILARRDHSCSELSQKLIGRGYPLDQIERAVSECLRLHYLDDEHYARLYALQLQRKGYGCRRIQEKLMAKGLTSQTITSCLENCCREEFQIQSCRQALSKKLKSNQSLEDSIAFRAKLYRFLFSRGFSPGVIRLVMADVLDQRE